MHSNQIRIPLCILLTHRKFTFHLFTLFVLLFLTISLTSILHAQKCGFDEKLEQLTKNDPAFAQNLNQQNEQWSKIKDQFISNNLVITTDTIPVVVHVMHLGESIGTGTNISEAQIKSAIANLNDAYGASGPYVGSADVGLRFALARFDTDCNQISGIYRVDASGYSSGGDNYGDVGITNNNDVAIKSISKLPNSTYYNIWVVSEIDNNGGGSGTQGYAYFAGASASVDGTVILYNAFGYDPDGSLGYNLKSYTRRNSTTTHELGHAFNLYHTFQGDDADPGPGYTAQCPANTTCGTSSDCCNDTPPHIRNASTCPDPSDPNSCTGGTQGDIPKNFMDYSSSSCQELFTSDQGLRIAAAMAGGRAGLKNSIGLTGLPSTFTQPAAPACQTTTAALGLSGGYGGLMELKIGTSSRVSSNTPSDHSTYGGNGYLNFLDDCATTFVLNEGATYTYEVETWFNNHNVKAWIDYDNDNNFEPAELIFDANVTGNVNGGNDRASGSFTIPATATTNNYLKLRILCDLGTVSDACYNPTYGQSENYPVYIRSNSSNNCPTDLSVSTNPATGNYQASNTLSTSGNVNITGTASFLAGTSITLNNGFHAQSGSTFTASIGACSAATTPNTKGIAYRQSPNANNHTLIEGDLNLKSVDLQIAPNPFNAETRFDYHLDQPSDISINILDVSGQLITPVLHSSYKSAGHHQVFFDGSNLEAGIYFVQLLTISENITKKIMVIR